MKSRSGGLGALSGLVLGTSVALGNLPAKASGDEYNFSISAGIEDVRCKVDDSLQQNNNKEVNIIGDFIYSKIVCENSDIFTPEQKEIIAEVVYGEEFQKELQELVKKLEKMSLFAILTAIALGFMYFFSYLPTLKSVKKGMPIREESFKGFATSSGGMALINGLSFGTLVYIETFILASLAVYYNKKILKNEKFIKILNG